MIGATLAHYRITAALGAGGMGEVWRAEDTKLGREVALKVLPQEFAADPDRMARFEREARVLASLNHPNIAHLYGLETAGAAPGERQGNSEFGIRNSEFSAVASPRTDADADADADSGSSPVTFLVMELVEGEDLSERIKRGPIPVEEAIAIAEQIAEALEAAHEQGVVHRDLKPANIKIKRDGTVKVLDFGLAKTWETDGDPLSSLSPTLTRHGTHGGVIVGTTAYMSPEQARGKRVDRRTDIWAFGVVLWEMLTGRRLFEGETEPDVMAGVLTFAPDLVEIEGAIPRPVVDVLRGALVPDVRRRFSSARDLVMMLRMAFREDGQQQVGHPRGRSGLRMVAVAAALALLVGALLGGLVSSRLGTDAPPPGVTRSSILEPEIILSSGVALSPNGRQLAFVVSRDDGDVIAVRSLDQFDSMTYPGTEGAMCPFFSADGRWVGYFTRHELRKVPVAGGQPRTVASFGGRIRFDPWSDASLPTADWSADDTIVVSSGFWREPANLPGLFTVPAAGGELTPITDLAGKELEHGWPSFTPDGRAIVFTVSGGGPGNRRLEIYDRDSGTRRVLMQGVADGHVLASGHLVFLDSFFSRVVAAPIDLGTFELEGPAIPLIEGVGREASQSYAVSRSGDVAYFALPPGEQDLRVVRVGFDGSVASLINRDGAWYQPRVSPDGRSLVVREVGDECRIWLYDIERRNLTPVTRDGDNHQPIWAAGGREIVYGREDVARGVQGLFRQTADGSFPPELLLDGNAIGGSASKSVPYPDSVAPDSSALLFERSSIATGSDLWIVAVPDGTPQQFLATPAFEGDGAFSPDGRWVAYVSDESGREEVYVRAYPGRGGRRQASVAGGRWPLWSQDGSRLYYGQGRRLMAVDFAGEGSDAIVGQPRQVLKGFNFGRGMFDLMPDGKSVVVVQAARSGAAEIRFITGWARELEEQVPIGEPR